MELFIEMVMKAQALAWAALGIGLTAIAASLTAILVTALKK